MEKIKKQVLSASRDLENLKKEVSNLVLGQEEVINSLIRSLLSNGHVLIEGVPGVAKTLLIRTLAAASGCNFSRIQFTVDLLPTDITGMTTYDERTKKFFVIKGPIFSNFVIADEVNRAPPKTQSALLEAMQEKQVTIGKTTHKLPQPFFVMANNNPIENSGTYPLPEAQIDRFIFKLNMGYPSPEDEEKVIDNNITINSFDSYKIKPVLSPSKIIRLQELTKKIYLSDKIKKYIVKLVNATRRPKEFGISLGRYIQWGCSPRASINLSIASKADALLNGNDFVTPQNVKNVAKDVLRHRILLNYQGQAEDINVEDIIDEILKKTPLP